MPYKDADTNRKYQTEWARKKRKKSLSLWLANGLRRECEICGESRGHILDYHHRVPEEKKFSVGASEVIKRRVDVVLNEIAKCIVLCSNCHRNHHWLEREKQRED